MTTAAEHKDQGLALYQAEKYPEAVAEFELAARAFADAGDPVAAAEMRNNLCVVRMAQQDWASAIEAVSGTPEFFRERGDKMREAQAVANMAAARDGAGEVEAAAGLYVTAIDLFGQLGEKDVRSACFKKLSGLQVKQGQKLQALASMRSGLRLSDDLTPQEKRLKGLLDRAMRMTGLGD
jgi:tetratricopeptide (TPR) repeat protein